MALLVAAATLVPEAGAATLFKDITSTDLNDATSWSTTSGASTPDPAAIATNDTLRFNEYFAPTAGTTYTSSLSANLTVGAIRVDYGSGGGGTAFGNIAIAAGNTLTLNGNNDYTTGTVQGIVLNSAVGGTLSIAANVRLGATQQWVNSRVLNVSGAIDLNGFELRSWVAGGTSSNLSGPISGTGGGIGLFTASSATGLLQLSGTLSGSFGLLHSANNAILAIAGTTTSGYSGNISLGVANGGTFRVDSGATLVTTGQFNQNWNKTLVINGTLTTGAAAISTNATTSLSGTGAFTHSTLHLFNQAVLNNTMTGTLRSDGNIVLGASSAGASSSGTLTLGAAGSTYAAGIQFGTTTTAASGTLNLNAGTLYVGAAGMFDGSTGANPITVSLGGGTLAAQAAWSSNLAMTLASSTTSTVNTAGGDIALSGDLGGSGNLRKSGVGTLSLTSVASTFTGAVTVAGGTLSVSKLANAGVNSSLGAGTGAFSINGGTLAYSGSGDSTNRTVDMLAGGTLAANGSGAVTFTAASVTQSGTASARTLTLSGSSTADNTLASAVGDSGTGANLTSLVKSGTGTWVLSGANTYGGSTSVNAGTLVLTGSVDSSSGVSVADGARFRVNSSTSGGILVSVASGGTVSGTGTVGWVSLANGGRLSPGISSAGVLTLGDLAVGQVAGDKGYIVLGVAGLPGLASLTSSLSLTGGITANGGAGSVVFDIGPQLAGLAEGRHDLLSYEGLLSADLSSFAWAGTKGARQGLEIVDAGGKLQLDVTADFPIWTGVGSDWSATSGNWVLSKGGDTAFLAGDTVRFDDTAASGLVEITEDVTPVSASFVSATRDYTVSSAGGFGIAGGALVKSGASTLTLNTSNAFDAGVTLAGGRVALGDATALGAGSVALSAGTLDLGGLTIANALVITGGSVDAKGGRLNGVVSGSGELSVDSTLTLGASATHTGGTRVSAGTLVLGAANALPDAGPVTLDGATAALSLASGPETVGALTLRGGASVQATSNLTVASLALESGSISGATTLTSGSYDLRSGSIAPALAGATGVVKTTAGTVILTGASTYTGTTTVSAGILQVGNGGNAGSIGGSGAGAAGNLVTVDAGATLRFLRTGLLDYKATARMRHVAGAGDIQVDGGVKLWNYTGTGLGFADANSWSNFSGRLIIVGGSEFQTIRNGRTAMGSAQVVLGDATTSGILSQIEGSWTWTNAIDLVGSANIIRNNSAAIAGGRYLKLQGVLSGSGNLTFEDSTGAIDSADRGFILTGANTLSGELAVNAHVRVGGVAGDDTTLGAGASGSLGAATVVIASGKALTFSRSDTHEVANILSGAGQVRIGSAGIAGSATQDITLSGANLHTGGTELLQGVLRVASLDALGNHTEGTAEGYLAVKGGSRFVYTGASATTTRRLFLDSGAATIEVADADTTLGWSDTAAKNQAFTKAGAGTLAIAGAFSGSASLTVSAGTLLLSGANTFGGGVTISAGALEVAGSGVLGGGAYAGAIANAGELRFSGSADQVLSGSLSGGGAIAKTGSGTLTLSSATSFSGTVAVSGGRLLLGHVGALGTSEVTVATGGTLDLAGLNPQSLIILAGGALANAGFWTGPVAVTGTVDAAFVNALVQDEVVAVAGSVIDLEGISKVVVYQSGQLLNLGTFGGTLAVSGALDLTSPAGRPLSGVLQLRPDGQVDFGASTYSGDVAYLGGAISGSFDGLVRVSGTGIVLAAGALGEGRVAVATGQSVAIGAGFLNDILLQGGSIASGRAGFAGTITLSGGSAVNLGIDPDSTEAASYVLASGGRLEGQGGVANLTIAEDGVLAVGNSPGLINVAGDLVLQGGGRQVLELQPDDGIGGVAEPGLHFDALAVAGFVDLSALGASNRFVLELISLANSTDQGPFYDWNPAGEYAWDIILVARDNVLLGGNSVLGTDLSSLFDLDTSRLLDPFGASISAANFGIRLTDTAIQLTYSAIPEPSTYGLALGALALAAAAARRRKRDEEMKG